MVYWGVVCKSVGRCILCRCLLSRGDGGFTGFGLAGYCFCGAMLCFFLSTAAAFVYFI